MRITGRDKIGEILEKYPVSLDVFFSNGFSYHSKEEFLEAVGEDTMLQTLLQVKEMNFELFLYHLENAILKDEQERTYVLEDFDPWDNLDFYGNTICPLKFTFKDALENLERNYAKQTGIRRKCYVEAGKNSNDSCDELWSDSNPEHFPGILFSKEFNEYLGKNFRDTMMGDRYFTADFYDNMKINPHFEEAGLLDPEKEFSIYAVMADVLLVDDQHLDGCPIPRNRAELLDPKYKDKIVLFGKDRTELSNATFLYIYKEFGMEGIRKLAHNVKNAMHGSQMAKIAGSASSDAGAIYIVSWFFAKTCVRPHTQIAWPEDGCMTLPMYMLVRRDMAEREQDIVDYVLGEDRKSVV